MTKKASKATAEGKKEEPVAKMDIEIEDQDAVEQKPEETATDDKAAGKEELQNEKTEVTSEEQTNDVTAGKRIEESEAKAKEWQDKYLRLSAEFDNYRKRTLKEKTDLIKSANEELLKDILRVVDDFERAMVHLDKSNDINGLKEGIHLIHGKFSEFLKQKGLKEIEAKGMAFDLDFHEALTKIPAPADDMKGKVVDVVEKGYTLNDKVIRYSKVVVGD